METGIYTIEHTPSGRVYVGSAVDFSRRWRIHRSFPKNGNHHSRHLQSAWNKYGSDSFEFKKIVICAKTDLIMYEQILIDGFMAADRKFGFNSRPKAESCLGLKMSDEAREKIRIARAKQVFSAETKALLSKLRTGKKMPDWFGPFIRAKKLGIKRSEETKAKISKAQLGAIRPKESNEKHGKINGEQAQEIYARFKNGGVTQCSLAKEFSLDPSSVSNIITGKRWAKFTNVKEK
jgi:group I intron endonuclease